MTNTDYCYLVVFRVISTHGGIVSVLQLFL